MAKKFALLDESGQKILGTVTYTGENGHSPIHTPHVEIREDVKVFPGMRYDPHKHAVNPPLNGKKILGIFRRK